MPATPGRRLKKFDVLLTTVYDLNPDVIEITELWASPEVLKSELHIHMEVFHCDRCAPNQHGEVLLYVKSVHGTAEHAMSSSFKDSILVQVQSEFVIGRPVQQ